MPSQLFKNFAHSTLAVALATGETSLSVPTGEGLRFPAITGSDYFLLVLQDATNTEVIKVTGRTGDSMTIVRAQEGTTSPATFASGSIVSLRLTAATLETAMAHVEDPTAAHAASAIAVTPVGNLAADDVQEALAELQGDVDSLNSGVSAVVDDVAAMDGRTLATGTLVAVADSDDAEFAYPGYIDANGGTYTNAAPLDALKAKIAGAFTVTNTSIATQFAMPLVAPIAGAFVESNSLATANRRHRMVTLADGRVLSVGGYDGSNALANCYFGTPAATGTYGANSMTWVAGTSLPVAKNGLTLTLLNDGRVLATGGNSGGTTLVSTCYFGTISGNTITWALASGSLPRALVDHSVVQVLPGTDDRLLLTGGWDGTTSRQETYFGTISGNSISWVSGTAMPTKLYGHEVTVDQSGWGTAPLMSGGHDGTTFSTRCYQLRISGNTIYYDPATPLPAPMWKHTVTSLHNGVLFVCAGAEDTHLSGNTYIGVRPSPYFGAIQWSAGSPLLWPKALHAATRLNDGRVLVSGGYYETGQTVADVHISTLMKVKVKL